MSQFSNFWSFWETIWKSFPYQIGRYSASEETVTDYSWGLLLSYAHYKHTFIQPTTWSSIIEQAVIFNYNDFYFKCAIYTSIVPVTRPERVLCAAITQIATAHRGESIADDAQSVTDSQLSAPVLATRMPVTTSAKNRIAVWVCTRKQCTWFR